MKKLFTILFAFFAVALLTGKFQQSLTDNQTNFQTEKVKLIVKFKAGVFQPDNYRHTIEDISSSSVQTAFKEFGVTAMEAVFKNRYNEDGERKPEILQLSNPHFLEGWQAIILNKDLADQFISQLKQLSEVEEAFIEEPFKIKPAIIPNDPDYAGGGQWHLNDPVFPNADIRAEQAWDINRGRNDVVIAILDGGVDYNHLDMDPGNRSRVIAGIDTGDGDNDPLDNLPDNNPESFAGHGTSVAGVVGAITDNGSQVAGVMWNCSIMPVKMVRSGGIRIPHILNWDWSTSAFPSDVADAIDYAVNNGANVINLSYSFPDMGWPINEVILRVPHIFQAIDNAYRNNVVITASMGNDFETDNRTRYPAGFREQVMAVGATTRTRTKANFSNTGSHISVSAPGVGIRTTERGGGIRSVSGTSFSAPLTAGVAGLVISQGRDRNFNLTNDDVRHIIELTAQDIGAVGYDNETGHGIVNARNALQLIDEPNVLYQYNSVGGTQTLIQNFSQWILLSGRWGIAAGTYINVDQYKITKQVTFEVPFCSPPTVWMRERESKSLDYGNPNSGRPEAIITNVTNTGFSLEYVTYYVRYNVLGQAINKWIPAAPASTNVAYTAVGIPNLAAIAGPINGPSLICSTGLYALQNTPVGASIVWSSNNPTGLSINPSTGVATRQNGFNGQATITATVNSGCGSINIPRTVNVGNYHPTGVSSYNSNCSGGNFNYLNTSLSAACTANTPIYFQYRITDPNYSNFVFTPVSVPSGATWSSSGGNLYMTVNAPPSQGSRSATIRLNATGPCGPYSVNFTSTAVNYYSSPFSISPNPSTENVTVSIDNENPSDNITQDFIYAINITDHIGTPKRSFEYKGGTKSVDISLQELKSGLYIISVFDGKTWSSERLIIQK